MKCVKCKKEMEIVQKSETGNPENEKKYERILYVCKNDDIWQTTEVPLSKKTKQVTVFMGCVIRDGKVLMVLRSEKELPGAHLKWEVPGGKVEYGETPQETVKRELLEETGVEVSVGELIPFVQMTYWEYEKEIIQTILLCFRCKFVRKIKILRKDHHVKDVKWVFLGDVGKLETLPGDKEFIKLASLEQ